MEIAVGAVAEETVLPSINDREARTRWGRCGAQALPDTTTAPIQSRMENPSMTTHVAPYPITPLAVRKTLPQIASLPLVGNLLDLNKDPLAFLRRVARTGDACGLRFGPFPHILFNHPQHAHSILLEHAQDFDKGAALHALLRVAIGDGLFSSEGAFHQRQRRLIAPPFQPRHIVQYAGLMGALSDQFQRSWPEEATPRNRRARQAIQAGRACLQRLIAERRQPLVARQDVLSLLLQARDAEGQAMTDEQVIAECLTLFVAGYETTATALTWTWYLLCQHPEAYEQMQEEVDTILQGRTPTYDDLAQLPYCLQVFKEALRLYPPAHILSRRAVRAVEIDGYPVPQGWSVLVVPYLLHRREDFFPDPEHFDPTRFSPQREQQLPRYAYLPFGAGPRICIGLHFAMMEGHLLLASLAQRSRFSLLPGQRIEPDPLHNLILRPSGPVHVLRTRR